MRFEITANLVSDDLDTVAGFAEKMQKVAGTLDLGHETTFTVEGVVTDADGREFVMHTVEVDTTKREVEG